MKEGDARKSASKTWTKTRVQNLVRHRSGRYYARLYENGKERWISLKTDHFGVAQAKLAEHLKGHKERRAAASAAASGKMTFGHALLIHRQRIERDASLKPNTVRYWNQTIDFLLASWTDLDGRELRRVTAEDCQQWAADIAPKTSDNRFNNTISLLRNVFKIGIESGVIYVNPADSVKRVAVKKKDMTLPSKAQLKAILEAMSSGSHGGADLAAGLAYTGIRLEEAAYLEWKDIDFDRQEIVVRGDPATRTKNGEIRHVPLTPAAEKLFRRMHEGEENKQEEQPRSNTSVFKTKSCIKALQRACRIAGAPPIAHHDLRHYFATACIESGVDIPTVSRWLGHKDGGALAMKTYGHLRREHSIAAAAKVQF